LLANDFLDMDMWLRLYILMNYALEFDIELGKFHVHVYPTVSPIRNQCQVGIFVVLGWTFTNIIGGSIHQPLLFLNHIFLSAEVYGCTIESKVYILSVILTITRSNCESS
jgi:hypothetical protein